MLTFYVEVGYGVVCTGDFSARASPLFASALIGAYNRLTAVGGVFHYPADGLAIESVCEQMERWLDYLRPDGLTLTFAPAQVSSGLRAHECHALASWLVRQSHCVPVESSATSAAIVVERGQLRSGMVSEIGVAMEPVELIRVPSATVETVASSKFSVFGAGLPHRGRSELRIIKPPFASFS
jgi:hypothetical protein